MSDDILNRIDTTIAEYVDWDGHSEDSVRQTSDGRTIDTRRYNAPAPPRRLRLRNATISIRPNNEGEWVTIAEGVDITTTVHTERTPEDDARALLDAEARLRNARIVAYSFARAWQEWIDSIRPAFEELRDVMAIVNAQQRNTFRRVLPPRVINPTRNRVPHQTNRYRGGHRG